ncbi:UbiH/UbiF/VisC/COQ6 family ubiquinone biosynthesis hydroxylase [Marinibaculum pumilum]|uniref:UbiH/UbiF/VisC/COQ6 family ubiquinone biosynthesis hydroxylase n=1 Tax=Marinibaculum pumilum TaxID=1766165 RepID=A0ABV7KY59_9PROT
MPEQVDGRPRPAGPQTAPALRADIAVVGGGLVGLAMAVALARVGASVAVVDRMAPSVQLQPEFDGRASAIAQANVRYLTALGVWQHLPPTAEIRQIRVSDGGSPFFLHYDCRDLERKGAAGGGGEPLGRMVENRHLRMALARTAADLPGIRLVAPAAVAGYRPGAAGGSHVDLDMADGRVLRARLCIAADGRASAMRALAGIEVQGWDYPQSGIVCTVRHSLPHDGIAQERFLPSGPFAILPLTDADDGMAPMHRASIVWTERQEAVEAYMALDDAAFAGEVARRFGDYLGPLRLEGPRWSYPLAFQIARDLVAPRLALIGDAAHGIHPIAGQGLNLGLRDVARLADELAGPLGLGLDPGAPDVLRRYAGGRRFDTVLMGVVTDGLNRLFSNDDPGLRLVRSLGLSAVDRVPPLKRLLMRHAMGDLVLGLGR